MPLWAKTRKDVFCMANRLPNRTKRNKQAEKEADARLEELLGAKKTDSGKIFKWIGIGAGALVLCGIGVFVLVNQRSKAASTEATYREYTVERGDIVVGDTESSSISLDREIIAFPVSATVEEVYVKAGSYVEEGAPLMKLNTDEIAMGLASYELELEEAGLALEQAKLTQTTGLIEAEQKYDDKKLTGEQADANEAISAAELEQAYLSAENSLYQAIENYDEYMEEYYEAYCELNSLRSTYKNKKNAYGSAVDALSNYLSGQGYSDISEISEAVSALEKEIAAMNVPVESTDEDEGVPTVDASANTADIAAKQQELEALQTVYEQAKAYSDAADTANAEYAEAEKAYDSAAESYEKTYGSLNYCTDYNTNIANLQLQVEKAALSLEKAQLNIDTGIQAAEQETEMAKAQAKAAATELELKETELQQAVDAAQEAYDALAAEIEEIKANISEDGIVYATCSGMVASVMFEAGDSFEVTYNPLTEAVVEQTLLTLTDIADVYVPITISEEDILNVSIGQEASVTMTAFAGQTFAAEVDTISVESSRSGAATVSYTVNVRFAGTNTQQMLEGMSAEVTLVQHQVLDVLYINASCVTNVGGRAVVLVRGEDGLPVEREVKTGFSDGRYVEIISGLEEGETVLMESAVQRS